MAELIKNALYNAIMAAVDANAEIKKLADNIYNQDNQKLALAATYRTARLAVEMALQGNDKLRVIREIMADMKTSLSRSITTDLRAAQQAGLENAARQLNGYGIKVTDAVVLETEIADVLEKAVGAVMASLDSQQATIEAILMAGLEESLILGGETQQGLLKPKPVADAGAFWATALFHDAFGYSTAVHGKSMNFRKQAIAALDLRTTDCCLRVHGQIREMDNDFKLTGTPRFADEMAWSPFHHRCRTSIALYHAAFDGGFTQKMVNSAKRILRERAAGIHNDYGPSNAFIE